MRITVRYADGGVEEFTKCHPLGANEAGMYVIQGLDGQPKALLNPIHVASVRYPDADNEVSIINAIVTG